MRSLDIAATGMLAQQRNVEVVSNNLANMNTTAYMRRRTEFHDLIYQDLRRVGTTSSDAGTIVPSGVQLGLGVKLAAVYRVQSKATWRPPTTLSTWSSRARGSSRSPCRPETPHTPATAPFNWTLTAGSSPMTDIRLFRAFRSLPTPST